MHIYIYVYTFCLFLGRTGLVEIFGESKRLSGQVWVQGLPGILGTPILPNPSALLASLSVCVWGQKPAYRV